MECATSAYTRCDATHFRRGCGAHLVTPREQLTRGKVTLESGPGHLFLTVIISCTIMLSTRHSGSDEDYVPVPSKAASAPTKRSRTNFENTSRKRSHKHSSIRTTQRKNVDEMVKALRRVPFPFCVVTLAAEQVTYLEYAHVVERATAPEIVSISICYTTKSS